MKAYMIVLPTNLKPRLAKVLLKRSDNSVRVGTSLALRH